jgi:hypothetical protein
MSAITMSARSRLDADDGELAFRFRALDEAGRRRLACTMVRRALAELAVPLPPHTAALLGTSGIATPAHLAELDRRAVRSGTGSLSDADFRRARALAAARYALSPQSRAAEEAVHEALHARISFRNALIEFRNQLQ